MNMIELLIKILKNSKYINKKVEVPMSGQIKFPSKEKKSKEYIFDSMI